MSNTADSEYAYKWLYENMDQSPYHFKTENELDE